MSVQIDSDSDDWNNIAEKIKEEFEVEVVAIQAGKPGQAYGGFARNDEVTFRELIGTIEFWKTKLTQDH